MIRLLSRAAATALVAGTVILTLQAVPGVADEVQQTAAMDGVRFSASGDLVLSSDVLAIDRNPDYIAWAQTENDWRFALSGFVKLHDRLPANLTELKQSGLLGFAATDVSGVALSLQELPLGASVPAGVLAAGFTPSLVEIRAPQAARPHTFSLEDIRHTTADMFQNRPEHPVAEGVVWDVHLMQIDQRLCDFARQEGRLPGSQAEFERLTRSTWVAGDGLYVPGEPGMRVAVDSASSTVHIWWSITGDLVMEFDHTYHITPAEQGFVTTPEIHPGENPAAAKWPTLVSSHWSAPQV
ncbi:MAG: hypothetical protein ABI743_00730 [bacterium]